MNLKQANPKPGRKTCRFYIDVEYDPERTDPEALSCAFDVLLDTARSTPGILDEYGEVRPDAFFVQTTATPTPNFEERERVWFAFGSKTAIRLDLGLDALHMFEFSTSAEMNAFLAGVSAMDGWTESQQFDTREEAEAFIREITSDE